MCLSKGSTLGIVWFSKLNKNDTAEMEEDVEDKEKNKSEFNASFFVLSAFPPLQQPSLHTVNAYIDGCLYQTLSEGRDRSVFPLEPQHLPLHLFHHGSPISI